MAKMKELEYIIEQIESGFLLPSSMFEMPVDEALRCRSLSEFAVPRQRVRDNMEDEISRAGLPSKPRFSYVAICETAFIRVFDLTEHAELAGEISDDFGLIGGTLLTNLEDEWLNALWLEYRAGRFPYRELTPIAGSLKNLLLPAAVQPRDALPNV